MMFGLHIPPDLRQQNTELIERPDMIWLTKEKYLEETLGVDEISCPSRRDRLVKYLDVRTFQTWLRRHRGLASDHGVEYDKSLGQVRRATQANDRASGTCPGQTFLAQL